MGVGLVVDFATKKNRRVHTPFRNAPRGFFFLPFAAHLRHPPRLTHQAQSTSHQAPTVVGYQQIDTVSVGKKRVCPTFLNVGESNKVSLADLKVTGYVPPSKNAKGAWQNGCSGGKFVLSKLNTSGISEANYYWIDFGNSSGPIGPGWFADMSGTPIEGGADKVVIPAGQAYWTQGSGYTLNFPAPELDAKKED